MATVRNAFAVQRAALEWLDDHPVDNMFLFFHVFDAHANPQGETSTLPYDPIDPKFRHFANAFDPPPTFERFRDTPHEAEGILLAANKGELALTEEEISYCIALYDDCIRMIDQATSELFEHLKNMGLYDKALIIVCSDHGEGFLEHGRFGHGDVYDENCRVPMLIKFPHSRFGGQRYSGLVQLSDILPTVLDVVNIPSSTACDGESLVEFIDSDENGHDVAYTRRLRWQSVRDLTWKLAYEHRSGKQELFNLVNDPREQSNLYNKEQVSSSGLQKQFEAFFSARRPGWHIQYYAGEHPVHGRLVLTTEDKFRSRSLAIGDQVGVSKMRGNARQIELLLEHVDDLDTLRAATASPDARVLLELSSQEPLDLVMGENRVRGATAQRILLDPAETWPSSSDASSAQDKPALIVWYIPPKHGGAAARDLTEEEREELRALGYLDDDE